MKELVFVTNNKHKLSEIRQILGDYCKIMSLEEIGFSEEIEETAPDLAGNALLKARHIHNRFGCNCFADDTGLEVDALDGAPGVFSARYAGENATYADNVKKLLEALAGNHNRTARFRTVIALILDNREYLFEGRVEGEILTEPCGLTGFGYDPVFRPLESKKSFAEMSAEEKNVISHRGRATAKLQTFLSLTVKEAK
ncbi:MAG: RdgB/HAM1 family non-canonical purine NTP pyrophosphatase [Porphyromonadaceae bacterium]|nr:MAG: RdgB/HAM1 family non-canonical purine NTP pyrophosphatase [Porphyromonadaceae bacterium]